MSDQKDEFDEIEDFGSLEEDEKFEALADVHAPNSFGDDGIEEEFVLQKGNKKYAVGLFWLVNDELSPASLTRKRAKLAKADFACSRDTVVYQHGFGYLSKGHRIGMPAAAAIVADALVGEWHAVLQADNGWWYLAVHGDAISPDGDRFFKSEEEAYNHFKIQSEKYKWPRMYAPSDWDLPNITTQLSLDRLLDQQTSAVLRPMTIDALFAGRRNKFIAGIGLLVFVAIIFLISLLPSLILSNLQEPPPFMAASEMNLNLGMVKAPPKAKVEETVLAEAKEIFSTLNLPKPSAVIATCGEQMSRLVRPIPGWDIIRASCVNNIATVRWQRRLGSLELLLKTAGVFPKGTLARFENNTFIVSLQLPDLSAMSKKNVPFDSKRIQLLLNNRFNHAGVLSVDYPSNNLSGGKSRSFFKKDEEQNIEKPSHLEMKFSTKVTPQTIASYFDLDGIELTSISWDFRTGDWSYVAKVHVEKN